MSHLELCNVTNRPGFYQSIVLDEQLTNRDLYRGPE